MPSKSTRIGGKCIRLLLLVAFALRLGWALSRPTSAESLQNLPDQVEYLTLAQNLLHGEGLSFVDPRFSDRVYAFRAPGYPLFLAGCGANVRVARVVQAMLDTSTVFAVFLLARRVTPGNARRPLLAAAMAAFNPLLVYFCGLLLSETLFVAMLVWGMYFLLAAFDSARSDEKVMQKKARTLPPFAIAGGLILALAVLVRPSAGGLPLLLGVGAVIANRPHVTAYQSLPKPSMIDRQLFLVIATILLLLTLVLAPWAMRNLHVLHHPIWTDTNAGITLYDGYNPSATGASDQSFVKEMPVLRQLDEIGRSKYLADRAMEFAIQNPRRVFQLIVAKVARTWSPIPLSGQFGGAFYRAALLSYAAPFDLLVLYGLWKGNLRRSVKVFLLLPAIYLTAVHALTVGSLRYRIPAEPALAVLAACAIGCCGREENRSTSRATG